MTKVFGKIVLMAIVLIIAVPVFAENSDRLGNYVAEQIREQREYQKQKYRRQMEEQPENLIEQNYDWREDCVDLRCP